MKHRGRIGPAALVGVGAAVIPVDHDDRNKTCVASVTSGTGEHMATTMAATVAADRIYHGVKRAKGGSMVAVEDDEALRSFVEKDFMGEQSLPDSKHHPLTEGRTSKCKEQQLCRCYRFALCQKDKGGSISLLCTQHRLLRKYSEVAVLYLFTQLICIIGTCVNAL